MPKFFKKKAKLITEAIKGNVINLSKAGEITNGKALQVILTEAEPVSDWIHYDSGDGMVMFHCLSNLRDGSVAQLNGSVKIECIMGQDTSREYAICEVIKNTSDLSTIFEFTTDHLGIAGIEMKLSKNCCFRLKLVPQTDDNVLIEVGLSNS